jgi:hypothetical protein
VEIVEQHGLDLKLTELEQHPLTRLAWVARAWNTDEMLRGVLEDENTTVLCLGCGLDTAYYRSGQRAARWYDMDLPPVIECRRRLIGEEERCAMIAASSARFKRVENISFSEMIEASRGMETVKGTSVPRRDDSSPAFCSVRFLFNRFASNLQMPVPRGPCWQ